MSLCSDGLSSDQYFLVNFIMSKYLGPDVYSENPRNSASQRLAKVLPPYTLKHIGSSTLSVAQLQSLYYYVLRNAESSLLLHPDMIYMYVKGYLPLEPVGKFHQFTSFFPTSLHPQKRYSSSHEIVKGIVVIEDPSVEFISKEELQRFRCLSRLNDLKIDRVASLSPQRVERRGSEQDCSRNGVVTSNALVANQDFKISAEVREPCKRKNEEGAVASCVISKTSETLSQDIPESQGTNCSRNKEETCNGPVSNEEYNSSAEVRETCKRKKEEGAVTSCMIGKTSETLSQDIPESQETNCSRNKEETCNGPASNQEYNSSVEVRETCKRKKEEEAFSSCVVKKTPENQGKEQDCSRNGEEASNGLVANQEYNSSAEVGETCKIRKKEEETFSSCVVRKTPENQGKEQDCSRNGEQASNRLVANQEYNSSAEVRETCMIREKEEDAVAVLCIISKTTERFSGDKPESQGTEQDCSRIGELTSNGLVSDQGCNSFVEPRETCKRKKDEEEEEEVAACREINKTPERFKETYKRKRFKKSSTKANDETPMEKDRTDEPIILELVPVPPDMKECDPEPSVITTGTVSKGNVGPSVGAFDIGVNKVAYFFQVALPGVRKDYGEFSCEIESDGKVILEGSTTTGGKTIERHSRVFEMNMRKLCPPGPFKLSFSLPGPVDPRLFSPNFRSDGIFEGVIIRHKHG